MNVANIILCKTQKLPTLSLPNSLVIIILERLVLRIASSQGGGTQFKLDASGMTKKESQLDAFLSPRGKFKEKKT